MHRRLKRGHCAVTIAMQPVADDRNVESQVLTARGRFWPEAMCENALLGSGADAA